MIPSFLILLTTTLALTIPNLSPKVTWPTFPNIQTNTAFKLSFDLQYPPWESKPSHHPLTINNPGPRPDYYYLMLSLAHTNGTIIRPVYGQQVYATDGPNNWKMEFFLPSYISKTTEFKWHLEMTNLDNLLHVVTGKKVTSLSNTFRISVPTHTSVPDDLFVKLGDGIENTFISLYNVFDHDGHPVLYDSKFQGSSVSSGPVQI
ncbi:hypothetical protein BC833DRAFT_658475 [Globomyces pollinis-pini]|nr:hypothetical protein BC833DRAFT_658475 [Globomyces pollinis-pini]